MKITPIQVTIKELTKNYSDDGDNGVFGYEPPYNQTCLSALLCVF